MFRHACIVGGLAIAFTAEAAPSRLSGDAIRTIVAGATVEIDTPAGAKLPVRYSADGMVSGEAGELAFYLGSAKDRGRWWIDGHRLCHKWFRWFDAEPQCLTLRQEGDRIHWRRDDGEKGTATIVARAEIAPPRKVPFVLGSTVPVPAAKPAARVAELPARAGGEEIKPPAPVPARPPVPASANEPAAPAATEHRLAAAPSTAGDARRPASGADSARAAVPLPERRPATIKPGSAGVRANRSPRTADPRALSFRVAGVDPFDVLYVRGGPSADYGPVGAIPPEARGVRLAGPCHLEWCRVQHKGIVGWVNSYYLTEEQQPNTDRRPDTPPSR